MEYLKNKFYYFLDDRLQMMSLIGFIAIAGVSVLNYLSEPNIEWVLRICIYSLGIILTFFIGHKGTWITWCLVAYVMFYFSHYRNISYFAIVCILINLYERLRYILLGGYAVNLFVICHLHNLSIKHIVFHIICAAFIYVSTDEINRRIKNLTDKKLDLKRDERIILEYLAQDIQKNDIPDFSPQTVSRKLRACRIRNGISTTKLLTEKFVAELEKAD